MARPQGSIKGWFRTALIATPLSAFLLYLGLICLGGFSGGLASSLIYLAYSVPIHFLGQLVIGLPFFLYFWPIPNFPVWRSSVAIVVGFLIGYFVMLVGVFLLTDWDRFWSNSSNFYGSLLGGCYGFVTALVAASVRKTALLQEEKSLE